MNIFSKIKISVFVPVVLVLMATITQAEVTINETRVFTTNNNTLLKIDDNPVTTAEFTQQTQGMNAEVQIDEDVNNDVTTGTATEINAENQVKGPVTRLLPLQVLGQDVVIDADTMLVNTNGTFTLGQLLKVSGSFTENNVLLASRIEATTALMEFKLIGHISSVNANVVGFGALNVDTSGVTLKDCSSGLQVGGLTELKATFVSNFDINTILDTVTDFECKSGIIILPGDNGSNTVQFSAEGFVTELIDATHFALNGQLVEHSAATIFINGSVDDLELGVKVEVEGDFDVANNRLTADKIKFLQVRVRITAPVTVTDLDSAQVTLLNVTGLFTALTRDDDNLLPLLSADTQIEIRGYLDSAGNVLVDRIRERGVPDSNDIRLRGPASNVSNPDFQILGVTIDVTGASFFIEDTAVDSATFFASLANGAEVDINHASYDAATNTSLGGEITLEEVANIGQKQSIEKVNENDASIQAEGLGAIGRGRLNNFTPPTGAAPVAVVVSNTIEANEGTSVTLNGSSSTGVALTFAWLQTAGPAVALVDDAASTTSFTAPEVTATTVLTFELTVTDSIGSTNSTTVNVSVANITAPPPTPPPTQPSGGGGGSLGMLWLIFISLFLKRSR